MKKALQLITGVAALLISMATQADVVVAGWDEDNLTSSARVTSTGVTGTWTFTVLDGSARWSRSNISRDLDGTFGLLNAGADTSSNGYCVAIDSRGTNITDTINTTYTSLLQNLRTRGDLKAV